MQNPRKLLSLVMLMIGFGMTAYPAVSDSVQIGKGKQIIEEIQNTWERINLDVQRERAEQYNNRLNTDPKNISLDTYYNILDTEDGIMGYLSIPAIQTELPIYHGVSDEVLRKGVGHIPGTAFPVGGEGNHSVLAGHTGLPSAELFSNLTELDLGDVFQIGVLGDRITYKVDQIKIVEPEEIQDILPVEGEDYCTLVTCTPYGINSHRLLVRGKRVKT